MAIASLVLGIISVVLGIFSGFGLSFLGIITGVVGIITGALGRKDPEKQSMATAGLVLSIVGTILSAILLIACGACIGAVGTAGSLASVH